MSCDVGEAMESLENELCSFFKLFVVSHTSQLILQAFRRFTYVMAHSPTLPSLYLLPLCHSSFSNPSFASPASQDFQLRHLASRPCFVLKKKAYHIQVLGLTQQCIYGPIFFCEATITSTSYLDIKQFLQPELFADNILDLVVFQ